MTQAEKIKQEQRDQAEQVNLIASLIDAAGIEINWGKLAAHEIYNLSDAVCRVYNGHTTEGIIKYWNAAQRNGYSAREMERSETDLAITMNGLMRRIGYAKINAALTQSLD